MKPGVSREAVVLAGCLAGTAVAHFAISRGLGQWREFSAVFLHLLRPFDAHGNLLLGAIAVAAFLLRRNAGVLRLVALAAAHPWRFAAAAFALLCAGALVVQEARPVAMDEYAPLFQAEAFAAGRLQGRLPPELLDALVPRFLQGYFFAVSRASGEVASQYWPGFALLLTPFAWAGVPWLLNPLVGALTLPAVHALATRLAGTPQAGGWALLLTAASPVFVASGLSYYAMAAHLLCNAVYALLLLAPTPARAFTAGVVGSLALVLHNPLPHLFFSLAFLAWLAFRVRSMHVLLALAAGYLPLCLLLGVGWHVHLAELRAAPSTAATGVMAAAGASLSSALTPPDLRVIDARLAGIAKLWSWAAAGLVVFALLGLLGNSLKTHAKLLAAALGVTLVGYLFVRFDQGHGWGFRYAHAAWFALPVLAGLYLAAADDAVRTMAAWCVVLSAVLAVGLRLVQVDAFVERHFAQVPPLAAAPDGTPEVVFVDIRRGFYSHDLVQNDPFLRSPRRVLVYPGERGAEALMRAHFPEHRRESRGDWGERWVAPR